MGRVVIKEHSFNQTFIQFVRISKRAGYRILDTGCWILDTGYVNQQWRSEERKLGRAEVRKIGREVIKEHSLLNQTFN